MSNPPRAATIFASLAAMSAEAGTSYARYAIPLDLPVLYRWVPDDVTAIDGTTVLGHTGGYPGRWKQVGSYTPGANPVDKGANLSDADTTVTWSSSARWRILPAATLTADRTITLSTSGATAGSLSEITRLDVSAYTLTVVNGGPSAGTLITLPAGVQFFCSCYFDGTNWLLRQAGALEFIP